MQQISHKVEREVIRLLPDIRMQVREELNKCGRVAGHAFYSDKKILETIPYAAYEMLILSWEIAPEFIDIDTMVHALDTKLFPSLPKIVCHTLRRLGELPS